jgi:hypothetical protein
MPKVSKNVKDYNDGGCFEKDTTNEFFTEAVLRQFARTGKWPCVLILDGPLMQTTRALLQVGVPAVNITVVESDPNTHAQQAASEFALTGVSCLQGDVFAHFLRHSERYEAVYFDLMTCLIYGSLASVRAMRSPNQVIAFTITNQDNGKGAKSRGIRLSKYMKKYSSKADSLDAAIEEQSERLGTTAKCSYDYGYRRNGCGKSMSFLMYELGAGGGLRDDTVFRMRSYVKESINTVRRGKVIVYWGGYSDASRTTLEDISVIDEHNLVAEPMNKEKRKDLRQVYGC